METARRCLSGNYFRSAITMIFFVIVTFNGVIAPIFSQHAAPRKNACTLSKTHGSTHHATVAKHAPDLVVTHYSTDYPAPTAYFAAFRQESRSALPVARSIYPTRGPPQILSVI